MEILQFKYYCPTQVKSLHFKPSFEPFLQHFRERLANDISMKNDMYKYIINSFEAQPELKGWFDDPGLLKNYRNLIDLLLLTILPVADSHDDKFIGLGTIFPEKIFYYTGPFRNLLLNGYDDSDINTSSGSAGYLRNYYSLIIEKCYGIKTEAFSQKIIRLDNQPGNNPRFYKIETDTQFISVVSAKNLPVANEKWSEMLFGSESEFEALTTQLPLSDFVVEGFVIFKAIDITAAEAMNRLKNGILDLHIKKQENVLNEIESVLGILLGNTTIKIGLVPFFKINNEIVTDTSYYEKTILISTLSRIPNNKINPKAAAEYFTWESSATIFEKVDQNTFIQNPILTGLQSLGIGSYMVIPLKNNGGDIIGILELATEKENIMSRQLLNRLEPALSYISDMLQFIINRFDEKINTVIKERFTPLQPSVEWKFNEAAWQFIRSKPQSETELPDVVFEDVFPLHGAIDIRNSSIERNNASQADFILQLNALMELNNAIAIKVDTPFSRDLYDKSALHVNVLQTIFNSDIEKKISDFMMLEVDPTLKHLSDEHPLIREEISDFFANTNPKTGDFHANARAYETSLQKINQSINNYLENERLKQYELYPHYFEKYRTDGVEYTLYIGESLKPAKPFNPVYLRNLRVWQLRSMAYIGSLTEQLAVSLKIPLQTTQLILARSKPITISFRKDERRFDVEGSYNIRYEVTKKRIDKIRIRNTEERLTRPCTVSVIYNDTNEAKEYRYHLDFLVSKGLYHANYEELELEDMQGVSGLKAFRAVINTSYFESQQS
jgi:hypothetical protein